MSDVCSVYAVECFLSCKQGNVAESFQPAEQQCASTGWGRTALRYFIIYTAGANCRNSVSFTAVSLNELWATETWWKISVVFKMQCFKTYYTLILATNPFLEERQENNLFEKKTTHAIINKVQDEPALDWLCEGNIDLLSNWITTEEMTKSISNKNTLFPTFVSEGTLV